MLEKELIAAVDKYDIHIIEMIRDEQLYKYGINGRETELMNIKPYTRATIKRKQKRHQPIDRVTLKDTGEFYGSLYVDHDEKGFYVTSADDDKREYLIDLYGPEIFRLTNENLSRFLKEYVKPELKKKMEAYLKEKNTW